MESAYAEAISPSADAINVGDESDPTYTSTADTDPAIGPPALDDRGPRLVPVWDIASDRGALLRERLDMSVVNDYRALMDDGVQFPPIVVFDDGSFLWVADGFHRVRAAVEAGIQKIAADVRSGSRRDAMLFAAGANAVQGRRRTLNERRRAVEVLLAEADWAKRTDREVARRAGVSRALVRKCRASSKTD